MPKVTTPDELHPLFIALTGRMGSGKSTVATYFKDKYNAAICPFAYGVKTEVYDYLADMHNNKKVSEEFIGFLTLGQIDQVIAAESLLGSPVRPVLPSDDEKVQWINSRKECLRPILQFWGTDFRRTQNPSYWIDKNIQRVERLVKNGCYTIVIDDMRFPNELQAMSEIGFNIVKLVLPNAEQLQRIVTRDGSVDPKNLNHESELQTDNMAANYIIDNGSEPYVLVAELERVISQILNLN
jgi:hypothetical protein